MVARNRFASIWYSEEDWSAVREQLGWLGRRYSRWMGQFILWGIVAAGACLIGATVLCANGSRLERTPDRASRPGAGH